MEKIELNTQKTKVRKLQHLHAVATNHNIGTGKILQFGNKLHGIGRTVNKTATRYLLNWEFFSNELEYQ